MYNYNHSLQQLSTKGFLDVTPEVTIWTSTALMQEIEYYEQHGRLAKLLDRWELDGDVEGSFFYTTNDKRLTPITVEDVEWFISEVNTIEQMAA
ncbi:hypothetical protein [Stenotrophomonas acidaminiphila]